MFLKTYDMTNTTTVSAECGTDVSQLHWMSLFSLVMPQMTHMLLTSSLVPFPIVCPRSPIDHFMIQKALNAHCQAHPTKY